MKSRVLIVIALLVGLAFWHGSRPAQAVIDPSCLGNVCTGSILVGGQTISYSWTQNHSNADSSLKIRFWSGPYSASPNPVRFKITVDQAFTSNTSLKNPSPTTSLPPDQTVNIGNTIIERSATASTAGTRFDFVQELRYAAPTPGVISVTLEFAQYGAAAIVPPFNISVDALSPINRDEGASLAALFGGGYRQCYDAIDNDSDYRLDCADSDCLGESISPTSVCQAAESTCNDGLDNDGDGLTDCGDPQCNGLPGNLAGTNFCGPENGGAAHANCADGFDNDANGKTDCYDNTASTGCWKTGFQGCQATEISCVDGVDNDTDIDYSDAVDTFPGSGAGTGYDCRDYDCQGQGNCTVNERMRYDVGSGTFIDTPAQCFDGVDNDLDRDIDCADINCLGAINGPQRCSGFEAYLPPSPLGTGDPLPLFYFNFCSDGIDNDGDGFMDALDTDCKNVFGECGPSPATEDFTFLSCSDAIDNDLDTTIDCADVQCRTGGKIGRAGCVNASCGAPAKYALTLTDAAACTANENSASYCGDGIDNDADGATDCSDAGCTAPAQRHGPTVGSSGVSPYFCGAESGAITCHDGADNDSDGGTDCFDTACQDSVQCARRPGAGGWSLAATCPVIPNTTPLAPIVAGGSVNVSHLDRLYVNAPYTIRFTGSGVFTSLTIVIGDAVNSANAFPFNASVASCALSGTGAGQMQYTSPYSTVGVINEVGSQTLNGFDVTLTCVSASAVPFGPEDFKVSYVANHAGVAEFGDITLWTRVYENTPPTLPNPAIEIEGIVAGTVNVPIGTTIRLQSVPNDDPSGICRCDFDLDGTPTSSPDGNCTTSVGPFVNDSPTFDITTEAVDGASNISSTSPTQTININVIPVVSENLVLGNDINGAAVLTYRGTDAVNLSTQFRTDTLSTFLATCRVFVYDANWVGGEAVTVVMTPTVIGNTLTCQGVYNVPAGLAAGRYWIFVEGTDSSGDVVRSNAQTFLKCENSDLGTGACKDADFDHDGTPEGRYTPNGYSSPPTPTYFGLPQPRACDNCINYYNPNQSDTNANGVGDSCEASAIGRCKYKYCGSAPDDPTPGGSCSTDDDCLSPDLCVVVDHPMCTVNCAVDNDCQPPNTTVIGVCSLDWGQCAGGLDEGNCCFSNNDCLSNTCQALVDPFVETISGQVYSAGDLQAGETSPIYNATYCLQSSGLITNFTSERGCTLSGGPAYVPPRRESNFVGSFGSIDVNGILNGKYGALATPVSVPNQLAGGVYYFPSGLTISAATTFQNSNGIARANGLIIVKGDLTINAELGYQDRNESDLKNLASVGWVVLKNDSGVGGGNVIINGAVNSVVGAFFAEDTISTGGGSSQLDATGVFVARNFNLERQFSSRTTGAEKVTFDARVILNPPPGLSDATRSLPGFRSVPGQ
ncbi:MAG: hypothetical protein WC866_02415 [Patescibacteria group bacterium]|jgi:hypothetical protein